MRWLLLKDLLILRRSPLVLALLVAYPLALGALIGFALSGDEGKPRVAFVNEVPSGQALQLGGGEEFGADRARAELCARVECVDADSRGQAEEMVREGEVLGALILPRDLVARLRSLTGLDPEPARVEVLVNEDDPVKAQLVDDRIQALVGEANLALAQRISAQAGEYIELLIDGGTFEVPLVGAEVPILGLGRAARLLERVQQELPAQSPVRDSLERVIEFARMAGENIDFALPLLGAIAEPIAVEKVTVAGAGTALDAFAIAIAAAVTLMFVSVLLVAGSLALEREENTYARLARVVAPGALLAGKLALGLVASLGVTLLLLVALTPFVSVAWERLPLILAALAVGGVAVAAFGAAIGSLAREVRAASLLAFMSALPIAFLSLIPSGVVGPTLFDMARVVRALFPFDPALDAIAAALDPSGGGIAAPLAHLLALALAYSALARLALRRFA